MTPDGRYVAFVSTFPDIVPGFAPPRATVYRWDRATGTTVAVSVSPTGDPSNESGTLFPPTPESVDISADGRYVAFTSQATNLTTDPVPGNRYEVFVRDMVAGTTTLVSTGPGVQPDGEGRYSRISRNGDYVSFRSSSTNLGPADDRSTSDVYRWQRSTGAITRVSVGLDAGGGVVEANGASNLSVPLEDGRVVFETAATNIVANTTLPSPADYHLAVANPVTRQIELVASGLLEDATPDGASVVFRSGGVREAPDTNGRSDVFVTDTATGSTRMVLRDASTGDSLAGGSSGAAISGDGRFVVARGGAGALAGDTTIGTSLYLKDLQSGAVYRANRLADGTPGPGGNDIQHPDVSDDGRRVAFDVTAGRPYLANSIDVSGYPWTIVSRTPRA